MREDYSKLQANLWRKEELERLEKMDKFERYSKLQDINENVKDYNTKQREAAKALQYQIDK